MTRAQRARLIRRRIITGAVALFVAAWMVIAITLISGNDPALSRDRTTAKVASKTTAATTTTTAATTTAATTTSAGGSTSLTPTTTTSTPTASTSASSGVTTHQS